MNDPLEPHINEDGKAYNGGNPVAYWAPILFISTLMLILIS